MRRSFIKSGIKIISKPTRNPDANEVRHSYLNISVKITVKATQTRVYDSGSLTWLTTWSYILLSRPTV